MENSQWNIIPAVNGMIKEASGTFVWPESCVLPGYDTAAEAVFAQRMERVGTYCFDEGEPILTVQMDAALPAEGYHLIIAGDGITISVSTVAGYHGALETLFQLLAEGKGTVSRVQIEDAPRFAKRSVMMDCCRHFFPVEDIKRVIEQMSIAHMNMFHWHLSDDQGYRIESRKFPELNSISSWRKLAVKDPCVTEYGAQPGARYGGYYTREEIRDVVTYAAARGVDVVPEIDLPGHSSAILSAFPQFTCTGAPLNVQNTFGVHSRIFCAGNEDTFTFLFALIDEIAALFPSPYFHIGGDEAPKAEWKKCPRCCDRMKKKGFASYEQLQCDFTERLAEHLRRIGKTPICWNESAIAGNLAPEAVIQYWAEMGAGESYCAREIPKGRKFILSNADQFYCTDSYAAMSLGCTQQYEPNVKRHPVPDENVLGVEMPMWTEWAPTAMETEPQMFPRLLAVAECGWTKEKDEQNLLMRAKGFVENPALCLMKAPAWEQITVHGEEALREIAMGLMAMGGRYHEMAAAEQAAGGEAGVVAAVEPDDTPKEDAAPQDPTLMIRAYVAGKMTNGFTKAEIDQVTAMVLQSMMPQA